jgi:hypothetical protein
MLLSKLAEAKQGKKGSSLVEGDTLARILELLDDVEKPAISVSDSPRKHLCDRIEALVAELKVLRRCSKVIKQYESDLASLFVGPACGARHVGHMDQMLERSYLMLFEADKQCRHHNKRIIELEAEVRRLVTVNQSLGKRLREHEAENTRKSMRLLQERCFDEVGENTERGRAVATLIEGYQQTYEAKNKLEHEVAKLRSSVDEGWSAIKMDGLFPTFEGNIFVEIQELREIIKEFVIQRPGLIEDGHSNFIVSNVPHQFQQSFLTDDFPANECTRRSEQQNTTISPGYYSLSQDASPGDGLGKSISEKCELTEDLFQQTDSARSV